jgi:O-antigen/teichoic acid export membrane protein
MPTGTTEPQPPPHDDPHLDVLRSPEAGHKVIRGSALRGGGYAIGVALTAVASIFLLRYLGVVDFGRFVTVVSLMAIVSGVTDAGLTAVGTRELSLRTTPQERHRLLANLIGIRMLVTPIGVLLATGFALIAGYPQVMVWGTLLAGLGVVLVSVQATMMLPASVSLRIGSVTIGEIAKQAAQVVAIVLLVIAGASLFPFFGVQIVAGLVALSITPWLVGRSYIVAPAFHRSEWSMLIREALPVAASLAMNVIYFRVLIILMSLMATATQTGLFATSFRVFEILFGIPTLVLSVALPVLATAGQEDEQRMRYVLQRMTEVGLVAAAYLALMIVILAKPAIELLGGSEYVAAAPMLRIQGFALLGVFCGQVWQLGLLSIRRQSAMAIANGIALGWVLVLGLVMIPQWAGIGAAVAAVIAETTLAAILYVLLRRAHAGVTPHLRFGWKVVLAFAAGSVALVVPGLPAVAIAILATLLYGGVAWATRLLPRELLDALISRKPVTE